MNDIEKLQRARHILNKLDEDLRKIPVKTMQDAYDFAMICFNARQK